MNRTVNRTPYRPTSRTPGRTAGASSARRCLGPGRQSGAARRGQVPGLGTSTRAATSPVSVPHVGHAPCAADSPRTQVPPWVALRVAVQVALRVAVQVALQVALRVASDSARPRPRARGLTCVVKGCPPSPGSTDNFPVDPRRRFQGDDHAEARKGGNHRLPVRPGRPQGPPAGAAGHPTRQHTTPPPEEQGRAGRVVRISGHLGWPAELHRYPLALRENRRDCSWIASGKRTFRYPATWACPLPWRWHRRGGCGRRRSGRPR